MKEDAVATVTLFEHEKTGRGMVASHESLAVEAAKRFLERTGRFVLAQNLQP
jgi:hypothetical protein